VLSEPLDGPNERLGDDKPANAPALLKYFEKLLTMIASSEWASAVSAGALYSSP